MSRQTTLSCMSIILSYWYFWDDIGKNGKTKDETQKYGSSKDSEYAKSLFTLIGQPISILGEHYDLNGCLQYHYNRLWTSSRVLELMSPQQVGPLSFQSNYRKRTLINILCKRGAEPEFLSAEYSEGGWYNSNLTYSHDYIRYEQSRGFLKRELEESTIVDPELDAIIVQRISELKEESLIEDLFTNIEEREISNEDMVKESHRTNRPNYGLVLSLPEDNTSNQSKVSLCIMRSSEEIGKVILSHMEAAFLYYLGAEREAGESYWLHAPNEHRELLLKIWNSLSLPRAFEDELAMDSPKKDSSTWIWDFRNNNRKTLRNQIQRKLKYLREDALDFNLITSIKPKSPSRGGNYKLNNQITSFEITPPSR